MHRRQTLEGMAKAAQHGRLPGRPKRVSDEAIRNVMLLGTIEAARLVGLTKAQYIQRRKRLEGEVGDG
jgi:DNA invertase Pin-like site-specific DNA recombinase